MPTIVNTRITPPPHGGGAPIRTLNTRPVHFKKRTEHSAPRMDWTGHRYKGTQELIINYGHIGRDHIRPGVREVVRANPLI